MTALVGDEVESDCGIAIRCRRRRNDQRGHFVIAGRKRPVRTVNRIALRSLTDDETFAFPRGAGIGCQEGKPVFDFENRPDRERKFGRYRLNDYIVKRNFRAGGNFAEVRCQSLRSDRVRLQMQARVFRAGLRRILSALRQEY